MKKLTNFWKLATLQTRTNRTLENARAPHVIHFVKSFIVILTFQLDKYVFVDCLSEQCIPAAHLEQELRSMLLSKSVGPFLIISTRASTITVDNDSMHSTLSIDHVSSAPGETSVKNKNDQWDIHRNLCDPPSTRLAGYEKSDKSKYLDKRNIMHIRADDIIWHVIS